MKCEECGKPATHVCSGLDTPAFALCDSCSCGHQVYCPAVRNQQAKIVKMGQGGGDTRPPRQEDQDSTSTNEPELPQ
jgi:hypothetical protein